ncbi:proteasome assembly chaperone 2 [Patella vulgata]|uniref:proteasome assembly chaperone 2 n=1 Tax=Patella vulgata TaxID=6465 RepID=UPI0021807579|nr:proteasome assembly chaperone 2 [Patella vulgata]
MFKLINGYSKNWENASVIIPCVSVGNVGQLAVDLIISTLDLQKVGYIYHSAILPIVGNDPYHKLPSNQCSLTTGCEVFLNKSSTVVVVQQRAPIVKGKKEIFSTWLSDWIKESKFKQVIILTSSFSHERIDQQIYGPQLRIVMSSSMEEQNSEKFLHKLKWLPLEKRSCASPYEMENSDSKKDMIYLPGSGIAKHILNKCKELPVLIMSLFCAEGDNIPEAVSLSNHLNTWLQLVDPQVDKSGSPLPCAWKIPESWKLIYGSGFDQTLFH